MCASRSGSARSALIDPIGCPDLSQLSDALQDDVIARPNSWTLERLFALKRQLFLCEQGYEYAIADAEEVGGEEVDG